MMDDKGFRPYVPAGDRMPELTAISVAAGIFLAVVFGAANAYLGLRVGMTVSASIPASVVSMGIMRIVLKRNSILESNIVQTIGSAGESLAAGAIFTMPVFFLWDKEGVGSAPGMLTISLIALLGGLLGVLFMVPLRNALIVKEHGILPYPEGTACAKVLLAGEEGGASARAVFVGMGISALAKVAIDGLRAVPGTVAFQVRALKTEFSTEVYPALLGVGYICGARIASYLFAGGILGWAVLIPLIVSFGGETISYPGISSVARMYAEGGAQAIWSSYIRYIGAGAVAAGGIFSLIKSLPLIAGTFRDTVRGIRRTGPRAESQTCERTSLDLDIRLVIAAVVLIIAAIALSPDIPVSFFGALLIAVFGFFFAAVSSRMVGLVGGSNNPVSGMAIATLLFATMALRAAGASGAQGMAGAIAIGSVICIIAAMAGDTSQDLKTGYILGATPRLQQIGELIGVAVSAVTIGSVLLLLDRAWGFGSAELSAPQATLMKMVVEGVMNGDLPWTLVFIGVSIAISAEILGVPVLPVAIGLYLPLKLSVPIMAGGLVRHALSKRAQGADGEEAGSGILFCSGLIAGEGVAGILLAVLAVVGAADAIDISGSFYTGAAGGLAVFILLAALIWIYARGKKR